MLSLFRRKPGAVPDAPEATDASEAVVEETSRPRGHTPSKKELGKVTPKRGAARRAVEPPPANRREAAKRLREKQRQSRREVMAGIRAGKEEYLPERDKGPDRALVRDIVDARRNLASYLLLALLVSFLGSSIALPWQIRVGATLFFYFYVACVVIDSVVLTRVVRRTLLERFPKKPLRPGTTWYAILRSMALRRTRRPAPRVKPGQKV